MAIRYPAAARDPQFLVRPEGELPGFIRQLFGPPPGQTPGVSTTPGQCEDGSRCNPAALIPQTAVERFLQRFERQLNAFNRWRIASSVMSKGLVIRWTQPVTDYLVNASGCLVIQCEVRASSRPQGRGFWVRHAPIRRGFSQELGIPRRVGNGTTETSLPVSSLAERPCRAQASVANDHPL
jgi:hypothetical protein